MTLKLLAPIQPVLELVDDRPEIKVTRVHHKSKHLPTMLEFMYIERGDNADWKALCELHYKGHNLAAGPRYVRCVYDDGVEKVLVGIMVFGNPRPLDSGRNVVFPRLKPNTNGMDSTLINKERMRWVNKHITWNNRTVLDTMFRGAGVAYRFKNLAYRMMGIKFVESRSSMSRFNPFSGKAGMKFVTPKAAAALEDGIRFFASILESPAYDFVAIKDEILALPEHQRARVIKMLQEFYYKKSSQEKSGEKRLLGMTRIEGMTLSNLLKQIQQVVFGATIYAIFENPDFGRELPTRIPLLAFDNQAPDAPLDLDAISQWVELNGHHHEA